MCSISFSDKETSLKSYSICQYVSGSNVDLLINIFNLPTDTINWINVGGGCDIPSHPFGYAPANML